MKITISVILLFGAICSFSQEKFENSKVLTGPKWSFNKPIYEVSIERASKEGTFKGFEKIIPDLKKLGVGIIWLQPIHERGAFRVDKNYIDSLGGCFIPVPEDKRIYGNTTSPYNINDHYSVNPNYGSKQDLKDLVNVVHENGMYIILDFVINHTSWGHIFVDEHPDFYKRNEKGAVVYTSPWKDIAQLDYSNKEVWCYMDTLMNHWIDEYDIDGFRTDVADRFPPEFWNWVKPRITKKKDIFMLAEGHSPKVLPSHDMVYDWNLAPAFWSVVHGKRDASVITNLIKWEREHYPPGYRAMRHATNHDTQGVGYAWPSMTQYFDQVFDEDWYKSVSMKDKFSGLLEAYMVLCATLPNGQPMIWTGQEFGVIQKTPQKIPFGEKEMLPFYQELFQLYKNHPSLIYGSFTEIQLLDLPTCYCFKRKIENETITVVVNISDRSISVTDEQLQIGRKAYDFFNQVDLSASSFSIGAGGYKVLIER